MLVPDNQIGKVDHSIAVKNVIWHISTVLEQAVELLHSDISLASTENMEQTPG